MPSAPRALILLRRPAAWNEDHPVMGEPACPYVLRPEEVKGQSRLLERPPGHQSPEERFVPKHGAGSLRRVFRLGKVMIGIHETIYIYFSSFIPTKFIPPFFYCK